MKKCSKCQQLKNKSFFCKNKRAKDGLFSHCRDCRIIYYKSITTIKKEKIKIRHNIRMNERFDNPIEVRKIRLKTLLIISRYRAKKRNLPFDLDKDWLDKNTPDTCPALGIPLIFNPRYGNHSFNCPSIDRIDNSKGYTKDNCVVVSKKANTIKNMSTISELKMVADFYSKF